MNNKPIRNIWAVGRNYKKHAAELGNEVPDQPMIFLKSGSTLQPDLNEIIFPDWVKDVHHEVELALQFSEKMEIENAYLAIDFTERTLQSQLKQRGHPWTLAKSFPGASAISPPIPFQSLKDLTSLHFELYVNNELRQKGNTSDMIFDIHQLVSYVKAHFPVCPGDLLLTGTPEGVGSIQNKDILEVCCPLGVKHVWKVAKPELRKTK